MLLYLVKNTYFTVQCVFETCTPSTKMVIGDKLVQVRGVIIPI